MSAKEATARIKINKLLEAAGWRFFSEGPAPANIRLEPAIAIQSVVLDALGADFEKVERGFVDFLLLDARGVPLIVLEKVFGLIPRFKSKDELLEEEFAKFVADRIPEPPSAIPAIKTYFKAYVTSNRVRDIIDRKQFTDLATNPVCSTRDFRAVPEKYRALVPEYIKDYVSLNQFAA